MIEVLNKDLFDQVETADALCITTNCSLVLNKDEEYSNLMGGGCAGAAKAKWPGLDTDYGLLLRAVGHVPVIIGSVDKLDSDDYFPSMCVMEDERCYIVAFPTMHSVQEPASLDLIIRSAYLLVDLVNINGWKRIVIGSPGSGIGGLSWENEVRPALESILDDRFFVFHKEFTSNVFTKKYFSESN